jgi:uncharacterized repeat protein (TIGR01451 family)
MSGQRNVKRIFVAVALLAGVVVPLQPLLAHAAFAGGGPALSTDKPDYSPEETVQVAGTGFTPGSYAIPVLRPDGTMVTGDGTFTAGWDLATADGSGAFSYSYQLDGVQGTYEVRAYSAGWSGDWTQTPIASVTFTDGLAKLDQCLNGPLSAPVPCTGSAWANGDAQATQAHWREGDSLPYRMRLTSLTAGTHTLGIQWDTTKGGKHAIDYLTSFDRTETTADPCSGVTGCTTATSTFPIPADPNVTVPQVAGSFTCFNCTITATSAYTLSGTYAGDSSTSITLTFDTSASNPVIAWGGHIAAQEDWGLGNSAGSINGSPYHTRLLSLDGKGGNQDRALAAAAVLPIPSSITTQVSTSTINPGDSVTDLATVTGGTITPTGTVTFFACGPSATPPDCSTGGVQVGNPITLIGGQATSDPFTPGTSASADGTYCFRAAYTPDPTAPYSPNTETNTTTECFTQLVAGIAITKTADKKVVSPTDQIGFKIRVTSTGPGDAYDVMMNDPLPTNAQGISWSIAGGTGAGDCQIISGPILTCDYGTMAAGASFTVHVVSPTAIQSPCDPNLPNTATVTTSNAGSAQARAYIKLLCTKLSLSLTADSSTATAGDTIGYTGLVKSYEKGAAYGVTLTDTLPANGGLVWTIDTVNSDAGCSISTGVLTCSWGTIGTQETRRVHITSPTSGAVIVHNSATVTSTNAANTPLTASRSIQVV